MYGMNDSVPSLHGVQVLGPTAAEYIPYLLFVDEDTITFRACKTSRYICCIFSDPQKVISPT